MQLIIVSHETLASAIVKTAEMFTGPAEDVGILQFQAGDSPDDFEDDLRAMVGERKAGEETMILCDLFAGTPFNVASKVSYQDDTIRVLYGMNLAMVVEAVLGRQTMSMDELTDSIMSQLPDSYGVGQF